MGLATIIGFLALFIAFVALWLVSDVLKKVETQNERFLKAHIKTLRDELHELDAGLLKLGKSIKANEDGLTGLDKRINDHTGQIDGLNTRVAKLAEDLEALDESIPPRYRNRVVKPKDPAAAPSRTKPTVQ